MAPTLEPTAATTSTTMARRTTPAPLDTADTTTMRRRIQQPPTPPPRRQRRWMSSTASMSLVERALATLGGISMLSSSCSSCHSLLSASYSASASSVVAASDPASSSTTTRTTIKARRHSDFFSPFPFPESRHSSVGVSHRQSPSQGPDPTVMDQTTMTLAEAAPNRFLLPVAPPRMSRMTMSRKDFKDYNNKDVSMKRGTYSSVRGFPSLRRNVQGNNGKNDGDKGRVGGAGGNQNKKQKSTAPSYAPSRSLRPSASPSAGPTSEPSVMPTVSPSASPSHFPTVSPSAAPTTDPPSQEPTFLPSVSPTTAGPSNVPTAPTQSPSATPSLSQFPSASPSAQEILGTVDVRLSVYDSSRTLRAIDVLVGREPELLAAVADAMTRLLCTQVSAVVVYNQNYVNHCRHYSRRRLGGGPLPSLHNDLAEERVVVVSKLEALDVDQSPPESYEGLSIVRDDLSRVFVADEEDKSVSSSDTLSDVLEPVTTETELVASPSNWTAWTVRYPVVQVGELYLDLALNNDPNLGGTTSAHEAAAIQRLQRVVQLALDMTIRGGQLDDWIRKYGVDMPTPAEEGDTNGDEESNEKEEISPEEEMNPITRNIITSVVGEEEETFLRVMAQDEAEREQEKIHINGALKSVYDEPLRPPPLHSLRIAGIALLFFVSVFSFILFTRSQSRRQEREWEAEFKERGQGGLGTEEGLDWMLQRGLVEGGTTPTQESNATAAPATAAAATALADSFRSSKSTSAAARKQQEEDQQEQMDEDLFAHRLPLPGSYMNITSIYHADGTVRVSQGTNSASSSVRNHREIYETEVDGVDGQSKAAVGASAAPSKSAAAPGKLPRYDSGTARHGPTTEEGTSMFAMPSLASLKNVAASTTSYTMGSLLQSFSGSVVEADEEADDDDDGANHDK